MKDSKPLVSVICLCYNQEAFVKQAIESVLNQDYNNFELIIVDDASTDKSVEVIQDIISNNPEIIFIKNTQNLGNCKSFNKGFKASKGKYLIDLAADDILLPNRISIGVSDLENKGIKYGVQYGAVDLIDEKDQLIGKFYDQINFEPLSGDIYKSLIERFFVSAPSMIMSRYVLEELKGYDESLSYEDFDFWIRSSRDYLYSFTNKTVVKKRVHNHSLSKKQQQFRNKFGQSTFIICEKIFQLNKNLPEHKSLIKRVYYEIKKSIQFGNIGIALQYYSLLKRIKRKIKETQ